MAINIGSKKAKLYIGSKKVKKAYLGDKKVYSSGSIVTYVVDSGVSYQEEKESGAIANQPATFTPSKSGYIFLGWRADTSAAASVYGDSSNGNLIVGDNPITLYAVFYKHVTVTYYDNSATAAKTAARLLYNNGNIINPPFTLTQTNVSGWTCRGWSTTNAGNAGITYNNGQTFRTGSDITLYGLYQQTITVTYYNGSTSAAYASAVRYSAPAGYINPSFTLSQTALSGWTARGWSTSTAANGGITYSNGSTFTRDSNVTLYGLYAQTITVTYYNNSASASSTSGTRYYNPGNGSIVNPSFTLSQAARSGWTARGWSTSAAANGGITYNNGAALTRDSSITLYGMYQQTITLTLYNGSSSPSYTSGTRYYNPGSGAVINPAFTVSAASLSGWSFNGWCTSSGATAGIAYSSISNTAFSANATLYGRYSQGITLYYNGNGGSGSTAAQSGTRYWNSGNVSNPSFSLRGNGFSRTGYSFSNWALNGAGGTQYAAGASITLSASATMYAVWTYTGSPFYVVQGYVAKQTVSWSTVSLENCKRAWAANFSAGQSLTTLYGEQNDSSKYAAFTMQSSAIATNGNHTIAIDVQGGNGPGVDITVNGVTKTGSGTFDISSLSSVVIIATGKIWPQSGNPYAQFINIRLY